MATRKKKSNKSGAKGFALLVIVIACALYFYNRSQEDVKADIQTAAETATKVTEELQSAAKTTTQALSELKSTVSEAVSTKNQTATDIKGLEIPVDKKDRDGITLVRTGFTVFYNDDYKTPYWVAWELTSSETTGEEGRKNKFSPDPDLPEPRAEHSDYTNSGYDRGHIAPAADMKWSEQAMAESFYMSNICPQNRKLNRDDWNDLEELCRAYAKKYGSVYIVGGPIYDTADPERIGTHRVSVPDRFFKAVLITNADTPIAMGFLFDNEAHHQALSKYLVSVDEVEAATGFDFFSALPDDVEDKIEAAVPELPASK